MAKMTLIEGLKRFYLTFRMWLFSLVGALILSIMLGTVMLFFIPLTVRYVLVPVYLLFVEIMAYPFVHLIAGTTGQVISNFRFNRKHKPTKYYLKNRKQIAEKMGIEYNKPIYLTDKPSVTGPFTNMFTGKICFPSSMVKELHLTENEATFGHELAHIKYRFRYVKEVMLVSFATWAFAALLAYFAIIPSFYMIAQFAFMMLVLSFVMRRNEYLADWAGGKATTPEALISVLEYFRGKSKGNGSSITHPSFQARIKRLERLFDSDKP
jgi:Zn-dependent protease with chaperone function